MIQVTLTFDSKYKWNTFQFSWIFQKLIRPAIEIKECLWFEIREVEED